MEAAFAGSWRPRQNAASKPGSNISGTESLVPAGYGDSRQKHKRKQQRISYVCWYSYFTPSLPSAIELFPGLGRRMIGGFSYKGENSAVLTRCAKPNSTYSYPPKVSLSNARANYNYPLLESRLAHTSNLTEPADDDMV